MNTGKNEERTTPPTFMHDGETGHVYCPRHGRRTADDQPTQTPPTLAEAAEYLRRFVSIAKADEKTDSLLTGDADNFLARIESTNGMTAAEMAETKAAAAQDWPW